MWRIIRPDAVEVLYNAKARASLSHYFSVMENKKPAKFMVSRAIEVEKIEGLDLEELWKLHEEKMKEFKEAEERAPLIKLKEKTPNLLDLKVEIAKKLMESCILCEHRCKVNRMAGQRGICKAGKELVVSSMFDHYGEEAELVPSFTVFTLGCSFKCLHCQNYSISQWLEKGEEMSPEEVAESVDQARRNGSRNLNCVGGNPDQYLYSWLRVFSKLKENIPIVWNSNAYYSYEQSLLLDGVVDLYLLDFKYGNDECAYEISGIKNYTNIVKRNHVKAKESGDLLIRILVLPSHLHCCLKPIVEWISKNLGENTRVNLMWQYYPAWRAWEREELRRRLTQEEMKESLRIAKEAGLKNIIT